MMLIWISRRTVPIKKPLRYSLTNTAITPTCTRLGVKLTIPLVELIVIGLDEENGYVAE